MDANHRLPKLRYLAWISAGTVSVMVLMNLSAFLVMQGYVGGGTPIAIFTIAAAALIGVVLGRKATTRNALILSLSIALYRPVLYALGWPLAFAQDLLRTAGIPGDSLRAMMALNPQPAAFFVILIISLVIFLSSRLFRKIFKLL